MKKQIMSVVLVLIMVLSVMPMTVFAAPKITLKSGAPAQSTVVAGETYNLKVAGVAVKFSTSNKKIATIGATTGNMKPVAPGTVTITAKNKKTGKTVATETFTVLQRAKNLKLNNGVKKEKLAVGEYITVEAVKTPETSTDVVKFFSSDKNVVKVGLYNGKITAVAPGVATVTAYAMRTKATATSARDNIVAFMTVEVSAENPTDKPNEDILQTELFSTATEQRNFVLKKCETEPLELSLLITVENGSPYKAVDIDAYNEGSGNAVTSYTFDDGVFRPDISKVGADGYQTTAYIAKYTKNGVKFNSDTVIVTVVDTDILSKKASLYTENNGGDTLTCSVEYPPLSVIEFFYQWQILKGEQWEDIIDANNQSFKPDVDGKYRCKVLGTVLLDIGADETEIKREACPFTEITSPETDFTVAEPETEHTPGLVECSKVYTVNPNTAVSMSVDVIPPDDGGTLTYKWFYSTVNSNIDGTPVADNELFKNAEGGTLDTLTVTPVKAGESIYFYCEVTNTYSGGAETSVSSPITVHCKSNTTNNAITVAEGFLIDSNCKMLFPDTDETGEIYNGNSDDLARFLANKVTPSLKKAPLGYALYDVKATDLGGTALTTPFDVAFPTPFDLTESSDISNLIFTLIHGIINDDGTVKTEPLPITVDLEANLIRTTSNSASPFLLAWATNDDTKNYTVTFHTNGQGSAPAQQSVLEGDTVLEPIVASISGWSFDGWYKDANCTEKYNFTTAVNGNLDLYAKWIKNTTGDTNENNSHTSLPHTGDKSNLFLWIALMFVSGTTLAGTVIYGRKKKYFR